MAWHGMAWAPERKLGRTIFSSDSDLLPRLLHGPNMQHGLSTYLPSVHTVALHWLCINIQAQICSSRTSQPASQPGIYLMPCQWAWMGMDGHGGYLFTRVCSFFSFFSFPITHLHMYSNVATVGLSVCRSVCRCFDLKFEKKKKILSAAHARTMHAPCNMF